MRTRPLISCYNSVCYRSKKQTADGLRTNHSRWVKTVQRAAAKEASDGRSAEERLRARAVADEARRAAFRDRGSRYHISSPGINYDYEWLRPWADDPRLLAAVNTVRLRRPPKCARREYYHMLCYIT